MQGLQGLDPTDFLAAGQEPLIKFEIFVTESPGTWINVCDIFEQVTDGGFEQWLDATDLKYWTESLSGASTINREDSEQHIGSHCVRFDIDASKSLVKETQAITLIPASPYSLTFWYKGSESSGTLMHLSLVNSGNNKWLDSGGSWESMDSYDGGFTVTSTTTWTKKTVNFSAHASYSDYNLAVRSCPHGHGNASCSVYVDNLSILRALPSGLEVSGNYLESANISLGGASMTPNPVEGTWSAVLFNQDSIFYPQHPTSELKDYIKTGVKARMSVGAKYSGIDYYWPRIIGYTNIPKFSIPDYKVSISGGDYMKHLRDTELRLPDNYWGAFTDPALSSHASDGIVGDELYVQGDAMEIGAGELGNVTNWTPANCAFLHLLEDSGGSTYVGQMTMSWPSDFTSVKNPGVATVTLDHYYKVSFKYKRISGSSISVYIYQDIGGADILCGLAGGLASDDWTTETIYFTAKKTGAVEMWIGGDDLLSGQFWIDQISIKEFTPYWLRYYQLPGASTGPYFVTLDGDPVWQGEEDEGWWHEEATKRVFFDINKTVAGGLDVVIYYFTQQEAEDVVARLLYKAGLYASEADAKTALTDAHAVELGYVDPNVQIDRVWFEPGTTCLDAIKKVCERCNYRFYFAWDGTPVFRPPLAVGEIDFIFTDPKHIASIRTYQDRNEIKNRIVIKGMKRAEPVSDEETMPSSWEGEAEDSDSITDYGERTLTISNHLFQDDAGITAIKNAILAERKDPKWYSDLKVPFNPIPLEIGDTIQWEERLSRTGVDTVVDITQTGIIRDIKLDNFNAMYKCELDLS